MRFGEHSCLNNVVKKKKSEVPRGEVVGWKHERVIRRRCAWWDRGKKDLPIGPGVTSVPCHSPSPQC